MPWLKKYRFEIISSLVYFALFVILSWPLLLNLNSSIVAMYGDSQYDIWLFDSVVNKNLIVNFPYGTTLANHILTPPYPLLDLWAKVTSLLIDSPVARYNLLVMISFPLTGIAGYFLSREFAKNKLWAFFAGLIIAFSPYHIIKATHHVNLTNLYFLIFFMLSAIKFSKKPSLPLGILSGSLLALTLLDHYQYGFAAAIIALIILLTGLIKEKCSKNYLKPLIWPIIGFLIAASTIISVLAPWIWQGLHGGFGSLERGFSEMELSVYSARRFMLFFAPPSTYLGHFFVDKYSAFIASSKDTIEESTIYFSTALIVTAVSAIFLAVKNFKKNREVAYLLALAIIAIFFLISSFTPNINLFGYQLRTLGSYMFDKVPVFRVWARFASVTMICSTVLGVYFLSELSNRFKIFAYAILALILIEIFPVKLQTRPTILPDDSIYYYIPQNEPCVLAEYPMLPSTEPTAYRYLSAQITNHCALIFGAVDNNSEAMRRKILDPSQSQTISELTRRNTNFIIIHSDMFENANISKFPAEYLDGITPIISDPRVELIKCVDHACLYKINPPTL